MEIGGKSPFAQMIPKFFYKCINTCTRAQAYSPCTDGAISLYHLVDKLGFRDHVRTCRVELI